MNAIVRALALAGVLLGARAACGLEAPDELARQIEKLEFLQAALAQGDQSSIEAYAKTLAALANQLAKAPASEWKDTRHSHAAVRYLLAGGQPGAIDRLLKKHAPPTENEILVGTLAYVSGRQADAKSRLDKVAIASLPKSLGAQVAFMKSVLLAPTDAPAAIFLLDFARTLAPGGLIEEAALRQQILLLVKGKDADKATRLFRQYISRFGRSVFADKFLDETIPTLAALDIANSLDEVRSLKFVSDILPDDKRRAFFLAISRAALLKGKLDVAQRTSIDAMALASSEGPEAATARLYIAAARVAQGDCAPCGEELGKLDPKKLSRADLGLLAGARSVAARLNNVIEAEPRGTLQLEEPPRTRVENSVDASVERGESALARVNGLIGK